MGNVTIIDRSAQALKEVAKIIGDNLIEFGESVVEVSMDNVPVDTGHLKNNIRMEPRNPNPDAMALAVVTETGYGAYVELGTSKTQARPYIAPAAKQVMAQFKKWGKK